MHFRLSGLCVAALLIALPGAAYRENSTTPGHIIVDASQRFQTIDGFGLNFTAPYFRDDQKAMFDKFIDDLGVTMFRVVPYLVASDWETTNPNSSADEMNWEYYDNRYSSPIFEATWNAIRYLNSRGIQPELAMMGPVPRWMLADSSTPPQHKVCVPDSKIPPINPSMYPEFAKELVSMLMYARSREHLKFQYFSPFNETDCYPNEGPRIDPADAPAVLDAVAEWLQKEGLGDIRLVVPDNAIITNDYTTPILHDDKLMKQVAAFAYHSYSDTSVGEQVVRVRSSKYAQTPVWLSEYGDLSDQDKTEANEWKSFVIASNRRALTALNQGANVLMYFNAFDDYEECMGRLTYYGLFHNADQVYYPRKRYYAIRQLYHFVHPGATRIGATATGEGLTVSAFENPGSGLVIVGVKEGGPNHIQLSLRGLPATPDHFDLYVTSRSFNCLKQGSFPVRAGSVDIDLPDQAVFTLLAASDSNHQ
jgi:O-glycosyl hydrolase